MAIYLKKVTLNDGTNELNYLRTVPEDENGFCRPAHEEDMANEASFKKWLVRKIEEEHGINLKNGRIPQTIYWVMDEENIVGIGKIRHYLNESLLEHGGLIGLGIAKDCRTKGIGTQTLQLLLNEAINEYGIEDVLLTNDETNIASRRIVEKCGGQLKKVENGSCWYWIKLEKTYKKSTVYNI